ncbi:hypothetical protein ZWY2020_041865 [Hordeum vulgare]|nr:hypothetical protein ZWY2020_041865 [Hordeum vulgare]
MFENSGLGAARLVSFPRNMEDGDKDVLKTSVSEESPNPGEKGELEGDLSKKTEMLNVKETVNSTSENSSDEVEGKDNPEKGLNEQMDKSRSPDAMEPIDSDHTVKEILEEEKSEDPVFDGTEIPEMEQLRRSSDQSVELDPKGQQGSVINERAAAIGNFVKEKGAIAVSTFIRRLSGRKDENDLPVEGDKNDGSASGNGEKTVSDSEIKPKEEVELEKNTGSSIVPKVYFNDLLIGGLTELKKMEESGILEKTGVLLNDEPSSAAPLPPLPGEDDESGCGKWMSWFYKMRRFSNCFPGSEAVDFISEDQYLERDEAVEFVRKLASKHFFIIDRFLDHDPVIMTQCYNIPRGIIDVAPKPMVEIASRLRKLSCAIFEAYVSEDGRHVDYRSIQACEEFKAHAVSRLITDNFASCLDCSTSYILYRYIRTTEELQRVETSDLSREEKLAFFINLYNMMAIHALVTYFKYVIGGCAYSLSAIENGILRGNQRPPYNLVKPFGQKDQRSKVALSYPEPLVHFALVCGTKSDLHFVYNTDFGKNETEVLKHAANYLEPAASEQFLSCLQTLN